MGGQSNQADYYKILIASNKAKTQTNKIQSTRASSL